MSEGNGYATREVLLAPLERRFKDVDIPGWGKFRIRSLTELERSRFEVSSLGKDGKLALGKTVDQKCRLIVLCVVDGSGNQLLTNSDIQQLQQQDSKFTNMIADAVIEHCGISNTDMDELEKNFEATTGANSQSS